MTAERFTLEIGETASFEAVRRGYQVHTETKYAGAETILTTLGEYAIQQPPGEPWQLTPAGTWDEQQNSRTTRPTYRPDWVTLEEMRTRAGEGTFVPDQMDALEQTLEAPHRVCTSSNKLDIATVDDLGRLLTRHKVSTDEWRPADLPNLFQYLQPPTQQVVENVSLHAIDDELWLATAQSMVNVYYKDGANQTWRLRELEKRYYDHDGLLGAPVASRQRSSLGETGQLLDGIPERPFDTARRGLREEIGVSEQDMSQLVATGSLLRLKRQGHHRYGPAIKAEDRTHYFDAWLHPGAVQPDGYTNIEVDSKQQPRVAITLRWSPVT